MDIASARVTSRGRITLPLKVRNELGVAAGSVVEFECSSDGKAWIVAKSQSPVVAQGTVESNQSLRADELTEATRGSMGEHRPEDASDL